MHDSSIGSRVPVALIGQHHGTQALSTVWAGHVTGGACGVEAVLAGQARVTYIAFCTHYLSKLTASHLY